MSNKFYKGLGRHDIWPEISAPMELTYDDVNIVPGVKTPLNSRSEVDPYVEIGPYKNILPIISAPMDSISALDENGDVQMIRALAKAGALGTLPVHKKGDSIKKHLELCERFTNEEVPCIYTVNFQDTIAEAEAYYARGARILMFDTAHGGQMRVERSVKELKDKFGANITLIAGNIATYLGAQWYKEMGVDIAKVGIGPGSVCTTRLTTGVGMPQISAIFDTRAAGISIIADGGLKHPGDVAKAMAAGANFVMIGGMFAGTEETPFEVNAAGQKLRKYRGQASEDYMTDNKIEKSKARTHEGISTEVANKGSVIEIVHRIEGGLRSAMSYVGAPDLKAFEEMATFTTVSTAAHLEGHPHFIQERK